jgi:hypothetical protein
MAGQTTSGVTLGAVDTTSDTNNCGSCGNVCNPPGNGSVSCVAGACRDVCGGGSTLCTGACVNTLTDANNCGFCSNVCAQGIPCVSGTCGCPNSQAECNGTCTNTAVDTNNCGSCGNECNSGPNGTGTCLSGSCQIVCNAGFKNCDGNPSNGCETNVSSDPNNCGACGNQCNAQHGTPACVSGLCAIVACNSGFKDCDGNPSNGCETNVNSDANNCGSCGNECFTPNGTPACANGSCAVAACNAGFKDCDGIAANGCETNVSNDARNCGACGTVCANGHSCVAGACN